MKSRKTIFTLVLLAVLLVFGLAWTEPVKAQTPSPAGLYLNPIGLTRANTCTPSEIEVRVQSVTNLTAYHLELTYNPAHIQILSIVNGGFLNATDAFYEPTNTFGADTGRIKWGMAQRGTDGDPVPRSGSGSLIKITFQPLVGDVTTRIALDIENSMLVDWPDAFSIPIEISSGDGGQNYILQDKVVANVTATPVVEYCSLGEALDQAKSGDELRFLRNFEVYDSPTVNSKNITINTNGYTATRNVTWANQSTLSVYGNATVNLIGNGSFVTQPTGSIILVTARSTVNVDGPTLSGGYRAVRVEGVTAVSNPGLPTNFTLQSGTLINGIRVIGKGANVTINGGTVSRSDGQPAITGDGTITEFNYYGGTTVTVNNGTIDGGTAAAIYNPQSGSVTINGGTLTGGSSAIEMERGFLTVNGGTITGVTDGILIDNALDRDTDGEISVDISGGVITGNSGYALRESVPDGASLRTTSVEISGGDFAGGLEGVIFSDELLAAASADPATAELALTDGRYSHDPDRFVFAPYGSYFESPWWLIGELVGTIERDPGNTGDIPGGTPLTVTVTDDTVDFQGDIAWYPADPTVGRTEGHRVGVEINAPAGYPTADTTFTFNGNPYNWNTVADGDNFVWIYPKVTAVPQSWDVVVTWKEGVTQTFTINVLTGSKLQVLLNADEFAYLNDPADTHGTFLGVNSSWTTNGGFIDDVASIKVELFGEDGNGDEVLLQTNTAKLTQFTDISEFSSPFNIYGKYDYTNSAWTNVRETEFGQHLPATRVKATVTLLDGRVLTAENTLITGNRADIVPTLNAQDFGYMASSGVKGVSAGFGTTKVTLDQAVSIKVELFTGPSTAYQLLQTNTAIAGTDLFSAITNFSSPFDIFGTFDYPTDGYWVNARQAEYGQKAIPTRVLATVELPGGFIMTAENTTLTGDRRTIVSTLDEEIAEAPNYVYDPVYEYSGDMTFDDTSNTYTMKYWPAEYLDGAPMRDLARYLGALHYQDISTVEKITYKGVEYTWDVNGTLVGSNWKDENDVTLVSVVVADLINQFPATATMTISDGLNTANVTFVVDVYNTLDDEIESAPIYVYDPVYNYVGTFAFVDATNTYTATYTDVNYNPGALYDLARYLGALHRQDGATVIKITYKGVDYTWDPQGTLHGSNWKDADSNTLVSVVGADFQNGVIVPGTGFTFTVADGIHTETVTFILVIQDTTPPTIGSIVAAGAAGFDDVTAVGTTLTVDHGYTVDHITVTLDEAVVVADGTVVSLAGVPYGTITANGAVLTIVPYPGNEVASIKGTFVFSVPAGSITDLAGNALATNTVTLVVNNLAPLAADDGYTTAEDTELSITAPGVLANDTDLDDLTAVLVAGPTNGTLTLNADGSFVYTPHANTNGTDSFTYKANDGTLDSNIATVTITVTAVNDAPVAQNVDATTPEDTAVDVTLLGTDVDGDTLTYTIVDQPAHGTLTIVGEVVTYTPNANWHGSDSFTYKVNDGTVDSNIAAVTITVTPVNDAPVAQDITVTTPEDTALDIKLLGTDVDGDTLTYLIVTDPAHGTVTIVDDIATYTPSANYNGTDSFTYKVNDGTVDSNVATVTITITPVKDQVIAVDDSYNVDQGQTLTIAVPGVYSNDINPDNDQWVVSLKTNVEHGNLALNQDGSFVYTPDPAFRGTDSFIYTLATYPATQSLWADDAKVTITVDPVYTLPTISSNDIEGPYTVGIRREFNVTLTNPADGATYSSLSASVFVDNITPDDFETVEVKHPVYGNWVPLSPVVEGSGLRLTLGPTGNFPLLPGQTFTLTFRVNFNTPGIYPAQGSLFNAAVTPPVEIASFNATLTVNHADNLDEQIAEAPNYVYDPAYVYTGDMTFDAASNTYSMMYWPAEYLDGAPMRDLARYLGALHYQDISTVESLSYKGVIYTWDPNGGLVGSNWKNGDVTLVSVIVADLLGQYPGTATVTLTDSLYTADVTFVVDVYNTLDDEIESAPGYVYTPAYTYVGTFAFEDATNTYTATYTDVNYNPGALYDLARYLGALHRQNSATVTKVTYKGVDYTWNPAEPLKGSNWEDASGTTLVSVVGADFQNGTIVPGTGFTFTVADGIHTETVTFILVINDTTAPEIVSITAIGADGFADVPAVNRVITVDQGYTVARTEIVLNEDVTVVDGTVVSIGTTPYGTITANGSTLTVTPYPNNEVASLPGSFVLSVSAGSVKDLAGNALVELSATLVVNNVAPAAADDAYTTEEDITLNVAAPGVLANDVDWTPLTVSLVDDVAHGTLTLNANGSFSYKPDLNWHGTDTFTYKASDGELESAVTTVTITVTPVNDAPVAQNVDATTPEDTAVDITLLGTDVDGDTLTYEIVGNPTNGTVTLVGNVVTYTPNANWYGTDTFTYKVNDGTVDSNVATVTITVTPVNDAPVAQNVDATTPEDTTVDITLLGTDVDGDTMTYAIVTQPAHGTATIVSNVVTYTPNANWHGTDTFTYKVNDGTLDSNVATVTITVTPVNDAPVAVDDAYTTNEDTVLTVAAPGVLANDYDVDGDNLTVTVKTNVSHGSLVLNGDGSFVYTPNENWFGTDTFVYNLISYPSVTAEGWTDEATVTITVTPVNVAPVAQNVDATTPEDTAIDVTLLGIDIDGDTLTYAIVDQPTNGTLTIVGNVATYTPNANWHGTDSFTYKVNDGTLDSNVATVTITVTPVNDAPVAVDDGYSTAYETALTVAAPGVLANDSDVENSPLTAALVAGPANGTVTLNADGSFTYTPAAGFSGTDSFTYKANDGELDSNVATVSIVVAASTNNPPVAVNDTYTTGFGVTLTVPVPGVLGNDTDTDNDPLTAIKVSDPAHGTLTFNANGSFTYVPNATFSGIDTFTYKANDGENDSNVATVSILVETAVNTPPVAQNQSVTTPEDTTRAITLTATDADGDTLTYWIVGQPQHGTVTLAGNVATYTPDQDYHGPDSFTFKANDGTTDSNLATVSITVTPVNDAPVAAEDEYTTDEGHTLTITAPGVLANDADVDGDALTVIKVSDPAHGTLTLNANGSFIYKPNAYFNGTDTFTYRAKDASLTSEIATVTINVTPVNNDVIANDDYYETPFNTAIVKDAAEGVLANDVLLDPDEEVSIQILDAPQHGTLNINDDGSFTYTPNPGFFGRDTFRYLLLSVRVNGEWSDDANVVLLVKPFINIYLPLMFK